MSFFEFPHTRTYDSDLGWLIKTVKGFDDRISALSSDISNIKTTQNEMQRMLSSVAAGRAAHKVLIISDSYLLHYNADTRLEYLAPFDSFTLSPHSGYGFMGNDGRHQYIDVINDMSDDESYTDVVFVGGYNDGTYLRNSGNHQTLREAIGQCIMAAHDKFHNAVISIGMYGWTKEATAAGAQQRVILADSVTRYYKYPYTYITEPGCKCTFITASDEILKNAAWIDDTFYHPNANGVDGIITSIVAHIHGESSGETFARTENADLESNFSDATLQLITRYSSHSVTHDLSTVGTLAYQAGTMQPDANITIGNLPSNALSLVPLSGYVLAIAQVGVVTPSGTVKTTVPIRITNIGVIQIYTRSTDVTWSTSTALAIFCCHIQYEI